MRWKSERLSKDSFPRERCLQGPITCTKEYVSTKPLADPWLQSFARDSNRSRSRLHVSALELTHHRRMRRACSSRAPAGVLGLSLESSDEPSSFDTKPAEIQLGLVRPISRPRPTAMNTNSARLAGGQDEHEEARRQCSSTGEVVIYAVTGDRPPTGDDATHVASSSLSAATPTEPPGCAPPPPVQNPAGATRIRGCCRRKRPIAVGAGGVVGMTGLFHLAVVLILAAARLVPVGAHPGGEWQHPRSRPRPHIPGAVDEELDFTRREGSEAGDAERGTCYDAEGTEPRLAGPAGRKASPWRRSGSTREIVEVRCG